MFKSETPCKQCGKSYWIQNKGKHLCADCVFKNNHEGKSKVEVYRERSKKKSKERKKTGEREMFLEIWQERQHICVNCKDWLGNTPKAIFFSHIKSKGAYPELRLNKDNIELLCSTCHTIWEFGSREKFYERTDKYLK